MRTLALALACSLAPSALATSITIPPSCSSTLSCTASLNAAISSCAGAPSCAISLLPGTYLLEGPEYGPRVTINNAQSLSITGAGDATILVANISTLFSISSSAGVSFSSFAVDMERVPFTYGRVTSTSPASSTVTFDATSLYRVELGRHPWLSRAQAIISYDPVKQRFTRGTDIYALDSPIPIQYLSPPSGPAAQLAVGAPLILNDWVVLRHQVYGYNAFTASACTGLAWTNVTLWGLAGMGIYTDSCSGIAIDGLRIEKRAGRPMSITADGVHFSNTRGGAITVRRSTFEGQGDDGLNAPTLFQFIVALAGDGRSFQVGGRGVAGAAAPYLRAGDTAQFFARGTLLPLGAALVQSIGANHTVLLAAPGLPPGAGLYALVNDAQQYAGSLEVTDCVFRANRARGALLKQSNVLCARNLFEGMTASAAKTETDGCYWQGA